MTRDFPGGPAVKTLPSKEGVWVPSLVTELRPLHASYQKAKT